MEAGTADVASNHETEPVNDAVDLDVEGVEGDVEVHKDDRDEGLVTDTVAWSEHPKTDTVKCQLCNCGRGR